MIINDIDFNSNYEIFFNQFKYNPIIQSNLYAEFNLLNQLTKIFKDKRYFDFSNFLDMSLLNHCLFNPLTIQFSMYKLMIKYNKLNINEIKQILNIVYYAKLLGGSNDMFNWCYSCKHLYIHPFCEKQPHTIWDVLTKFYKLKLE